MALKMIGAALVLTMGLGLAAGAAIAHDDLGPMPTSPGGKAAYIRHGNFKQQGAAFKAILDEAKKDSPDMAVISANATKLKTLSDQLPSWFPKGSGSESGTKTDAKAEVWTDAAGFAAAARNFQGETAKLQQLASAGDLAGVRGDLKAVGAACKACHDKYRVPEKK
jgi:cytochrome c556